MLPDDVLLCIFYLVRPEYDRLWHLSWWQPLVHVCRRWRGIVFASPNFLELRLVCDPWIRAGLTAIWPPIPIIIWNLGNDADRAMPEDYDFDAAIVHPNRVCEIHLQFASSQLQQLASAMEKPFTALVHLALETFPDSPPALILPDGFLGGSAPRLQSLELNRIPFPALPSLLSATDLVSLTLQDIPRSGYISPEVFVAHLTMLTNLESLNIDFESFLSPPSRRPPLSTRTVFPSLICFQFRGISNYLEDLVSRIDAPLLESISITFCHLLISNIPHLAQFIRRTTRIQTLREAHVDFNHYYLVVQSLPLPLIRDKKSGSIISCVGTDWRVSSLVQFLTSLFPSIFMAEHLYIHGTASSLPQDDVEDMQLLEFSLAFATVKNIYVPVEFAEWFAPILQEHVGETATDVAALPSLESLCLEDLQPSEPLREALGQFVAARQLIGHPVAISYRNWVEEVLSR
jgi:hypothetical protein